MKFSLTTTPEKYNNLKMKRETSAEQKRMTPVDDISKHEAILTSLLLPYTEAVRQRKDNPYQIPKVEQYLAVCSEHANIVSFNTNQFLPTHLRSSQSDLESTVHEKHASTVKWLMENKALNPSTLAHFFARPENQAILEGVLDIIYYMNSDNFVEFFRCYLGATGFMSLVLSNDINSIPEHCHLDVEDDIELDISLQFLSGCNIRDRGILTTLLVIFSKYFVCHDEAYRQSTLPVDDTWKEIYALCSCLLTHSQSSSFSSSSSSTLSDFFSAVRLFAKHNRALFAPRSLTFMFNTLKTNGPFRSSDSDSDAALPPFLFSRHGVGCSTRVCVAWNDANDSFKSHRIVLTTTALYFFDDPEEKGLAYAYLLGSVVHCIPLCGLRVQESETEYLSLELLPYEQHSRIPFFSLASSQDSESSGSGAADNGEISLEQCSLVLLKVHSIEDHSALLDCLESALWKTRRHI